MPSEPPLLSTKTQIPPLPPQRVQRAFLLNLLVGASLATPFFVAGSLSLLALILIIALLPESLPTTERIGGDKKQAALDLREWWRALFSPAGSLLVLAFVATGGVMVFYGILGPYALERFGYGTEQVGVIFMILGFVTAVGQGVLVGPITKRFGDGNVIRVGFLFSSLGLLAVLVADSYEPLLVTIGLFSPCSAVLIPAILSLT